MNQEAGYRPTQNTKEGFIRQAGNEVFSQAKDLLSRFSGRRNLKPGESLNLGYSFNGHSVCQIGGERVRGEKLEALQVNLVGVPNETVLVEFHVSTHGPSFENKGKRAVIIRTKARSGQKDDGHHSKGTIRLQPGETALLHPQGGDIYTMEWQTWEGKDVRLTFQGQYASHDEESKVTEIRF